MSDQRTFCIGGVWGFHIEWLDYAKGRVAGHYTPRPRVGDTLRCGMESGRMGLFRFTAVELKMDPPDMFFATVEDFGYEDEIG